MVLLGQVFGSDIVSSFPDSWEPVSDSASTVFHSENRTHSAFASFREMFWHLVWLSYLQHHHPHSPAFAHLEGAAFVLGKVTHFAICSCMLMEKAFITFLKTLHSKYFHKAINLSCSMPPPQLPFLPDTESN